MTRPLNNTAIPPFEIAMKIAKNEAAQAKEHVETCPDCKSANIKTWHEANGPDDYRWAMKCLECGLEMEE